MVSRAERSSVADWWWTVDRWLLAAVGALIVCGLVLIMAGSPPVAERIGLPTFHFVNKQAMFLAPSVFVMIAISFLPPRQLRRVALVLYILAMAGVFAALLFGHEVKGARRWIFGAQPSEFLKPAFVILTAWAVSEGARRRDVPGNWLALLLLPVTIVPLVLQPDFGQTMLICLVWGALFVMAGMHWIWFPALGGLGVVGAGLAYNFAPHVRARIQSFFNPGEGGGQADTFQVETARDAFVSGGWFGKGPGEGTFKQILPDSHTDFIFAVTGEEFGLIFCMALVGAVRLHRAAQPDQGVEQRGPVLPFRRGGAGADVRHPGVDQHRRQPPPDAGQGHDAAVHLLWRIVAAVSRHRHGFSDSGDAQASALGNPFRSPARAGRTGRLMESDNLILIAAGGTGGHLFPAAALAHELIARGARVRLATDDRAQKYAAEFPAEAVHEIASATPTGSGVASKLMARAHARQWRARILNLAGDLKPARHRRLRRLSDGAAGARGVACAACR